MRKKVSTFLDINPTVRFLTASDAVFSAGVGLFGPIFAVYLTEQLPSANALEVIGVGTSIYLFTRSIGQIPLAYVIDKIKGERDDFYFLMGGALIGIVVPLLYLTISEAWHLFLIQFLFGIAGAMAFPSWAAIFTRHIDKGREGVEWGMYQTFIDMAGAVAAPVGAVIVTVYGYPAVMYCASVLSAISAILIFGIRSQLRNR